MFPLSIDETANLINHSKKDLTLVIPLGKSSLIKKKPQSLPLHSTTPIISPLSKDPLYQLIAFLENQEKRYTKQVTTQSENNYSQIKIPKSLLSPIKNLNNRVKVS